MLELRTTENSELRRTDTKGQWVSYRLKCSPNQEFWLEIGAIPGTKGGFVAVDDVIVHEGITCQSLDPTTPTTPTTTSKQSFFVLDILILYLYFK